MRPARSNVRIRWINHQILTHLLPPKDGRIRHTGGVGAPFLTPSTPSVLDPARSRRRHFHAPTCRLHHRSTVYPERRSTMHLVGTKRSRGANSVPGRECPSLQRPRDLVRWSPFDSDVLSAPAYTLEHRHRSDGDVALRREVGRRTASLRNVLTNVQAVLLPSTWLIPRNHCRRWVWKAKGPVSCAQRVSRRVLLSHEHDDDHKSSRPPESSPPH